MDRQYVGIDFHRRRSVVVRLSADGERLGVHRIVNEPFEFVKVLSLCGESPEVVIEATYGWYWAVDLLQEALLALKDLKFDRFPKRDRTRSHAIATVQDAIKEGKMLDQIVTRPLGS